MSGNHTGDPPGGEAAAPDLVGRGYASYTGAVKDAAVVRRAEREEKNSGEGYIHLITEKSELVEALAVSFGVSFESFATEASLRASYARTTEVKSGGIYALFRYRWILDRWRLSRSEPTAEALRLLGEHGAREFARTFGDRYIWEVDVGGEVLALFSFSYDSASERQQALLEIKGAHGPWKTDLELQTRMNRLKQRSVTNVQWRHTGGHIGAVTNFKEYLAAIKDYPGTVEQRPTHFIADTRPYEDMEGGEEFWEAVEVRETLNRLGRLSVRLGESVDEWTDAEKNPGRYAEPAGRTGRVLDALRSAYEEVSREGTRLINDPIGYIPSLDLVEAEAEAVRWADGPDPHPELSVARIHEYIASGKPISAVWRSPKHIGDLQRHADYTVRWNGKTWTGTGYNRQAAKSETYNAAGAPPSAGYFNLWNALFKYGDGGRLLSVKLHGKTLPVNGVVTLLRADL